MNSALYYAIKLAVSAAIIVAISEVAKRSSGFAALIAALPITSILAFVWMHTEGASSNDLAAFSTQILWLVVPSLILFLLFPVLLKHGLAFWLSLAISCAATAAAYLLLLPIMRKFGVQL